MAKWTQLGLEIEEGLTFEEWEPLVNEGLDRESAAQLAIGDAMVYGEDHYGDEAYQAVDPDEYNPRTLANYAYVAREIPMFMRREGVKFTHYREIAPVEDHQQRMELIERVAAGEMTSRDIASWKADNGEGGDGAETHICPACNGDGRLDAGKAEKLTALMGEFSTLA